MSDRTSHVVTCRRERALLPRGLNHVWRAFLYQFRRSQRRDLTLRALHSDKFPQVHPYQHVHVPRRRSESIPHSFSRGPWGCATREPAGIVGNPTPGETRCSERVRVRPCRTNRLIWYRAQESGVRSVPCPQAYENISNRGVCAPLCLCSLG